MNTILSKAAPAGAVDTHFHLFDGGQAVPGARYVPDYDAPYERWQAQAAQAGIGRGVLVQTSFLGTDNQRLLRELRAQPEQLRGVAVLAPDAAPAQVARLHRAGVRGVRLNLAGRPAAIESWQRAAALWDAMAEHGWHLELHTDIGALPSLLSRLPERLPLVIDHMGKPAAVRADDPTLRAVCQRARSAPVWIKLSGPYRLGGLDAGALARCWLQALGAASLLWGSDWPFTNHEHETDYARLRRALDEWLEPALVEQVLVTNPQALYWAA